MHDGVLCITCRNLALLSLPTSPNAGMLWLKMDLLKGPPAGVVDPPDKSSGDHNLEKPTGRAEKRNAAASTVHKYIYIYVSNESFFLH